LSVVRCPLSVSLATLYDQAGFTANCLLPPACYPLPVLLDRPGREDYL
jgi:hypothetical protein